ncbi:MAG: hypothetical protein EOP06_26645 [Proteobacteria bacterium]|nr:MAG: hypothetical protein EOP06_26645 [Pseudomonadota bacterium]
MITVNRSKSWIFPSQIISKYYTFEYFEIPTGYTRRDEFGAEQYRFGNIHPYDSFFKVEFRDKDGKPLFYVL